MLIEGIRGKDALTVGPFRVSQVVGLICFVIGVTLLILMFVKHKNQKLEEEVYEGVYSKAKEELSENVEETIETTETTETTETNEVKEAEVSEVSKTSEETEVFESYESEE